MVGCAESDPLRSDGPGGPVPRVEVSVGFSDAPLEGTIFLSPEEESVGWRYSVDVDEDGQFDHVGVLEARIGFLYRFSSPGIHRIAIELEGPAGAEVTEWPVVVNDPEAIRLLAQRSIVTADPSGGATFEGITIDPAGAWLYLGDFSRQQVFRADAATLEPLGPPVDVPAWGGPEGLSVIPSDTLLLVGHKRSSLSVVALPEMTLRRQLPMPGEFYVQALDDTLALTSGMGVNVFDIRTGDGVASAGIQNAWHFSVSPAADRVAVLEERESIIHLLTLPGLAEIGRIPLPVLGVDLVAFDPAGDRLYVMGRGDGVARFVLVDPTEGRILRNLPLAPGGCSWFCVANPTATSSTGRYVAMEAASGVYVIDTEVDLPLYHTSVGLSVAAAPAGDGFYVLRPDGLLSRIEVDP